MPQIFSQVEPVSLDAVKLSPNFKTMSSHNHYGTFMAFIYDKVLHFPVRKIRWAVVDAIKQADINNAVDLCGGTGNQVLWLRKAGIRHVTGVDIFDNMLRRAWRNGLKDVCLKMDASNTSFAGNSFDAAIISFSLHETQAKIAEAIFSEAKRIVIPGGLIIVVDYCFDSDTRHVGRFAA